MAESGPVQPELAEGGFRLRRPVLAAIWAIGCPVAVWLAAFGACLMLQALGVPDFSAILAASLVTASFIAHAALLLDEDHVAELLG
jgi:hypothetical protein